MVSGKEPLTAGTEGGLVRAVTGYVRTLRQAAHAAPARGQHARWTRLGLLAALLAAAWLVPVLLQLIRLDALQPLLLLAAVASVLRAGTTVLDRFMLAAGLLAGALLAGGLLFSVWPWGLDPVAVGGTCFSLVALTGWSTRRRPALPRRWLATDAVVLGAGALAFWAARAPVAGAGTAGSLVFSTRTSDRFRHFALFDAIHGLGGYAFLHQQQAGRYLPGSTAAVYPSGAHFLLALTDTFVRSTPDPGPAVAEFARYFSSVLASYAFLVMATVWAARWIAGPRVAGWRRFVTCAAVATLVLGAPLPSAFILGLDPDILGLAFLAIGVAVTVRPPGQVREQVLLACCLLIAVAYSYELFAVPLVLGMAGAAVIYRRRLRRHWRFTVATAAIGGAVAVFPPAVSLAAGLNAQSLSLAATGWLVPLPWPLVAGLAAVFLVTLADPPSHRLPAMKALAVQVLLAAGVTGAFALYQVNKLGHTSYYLNKLMMAGYLIAVLALGTVSSVLRPRRPRARHGKLLGRLREAGLAVAAGLAAASLVTVTQAALSGRSPLIWTSSSLATWANGGVRARWGPALAVLARRHLVGDGMPTLVFVGQPRTDAYAEFFAAVVNRDYGLMNKQITVVHEAFLWGEQHGLPVWRQELRAARQIVSQSPFPVRIVVAGRGLAAELRATLPAHPGAGFSVVLLPALRPAKAARTAVSS